ncbi:MAG: hypothetical protein Q9209_001369 [Squamulea sp. 1 TL-2023]
MSEQVFHALAFNGRLSFSGLIHHTHFSPTEVKHSLSVLIQQHLVLWYDPDNVGQASYEANLERSYLLVRSGKYIQLLNGRFGEFAGNLILHVIILGHVSVGDLTRTYFPAVDERGPLSEIVASDHPLESNDQHLVQLNGDTGKAPHTVDKLHSTIRDFLRAGLLCPVHESFLRPTADNVAEAQHLVPRDGSIKTKKNQEKAWELAVQKKLEDWKYGSDADIKAFAQNLHSTKRPFDGDYDEVPAKKRKITDSRTNGSCGTARDQGSASSGWLDHDLIIRVSYEKLTIIMRNQQLVALAQESIGTPTSIVYAELLRVAESQLRNCKNEFHVSDNKFESEVGPLLEVSTDELIEIKYLLHDSTSLSDAIGYVDPSRIDIGKILHKSRKRKKRRKSIQEDTEKASVEGPASSDESEDTSDESDSDRTENDNNSNSVSSPGADGGYPSKGLNHQTPDTTPDTTPKTSAAVSPIETLRQHLLLLSDQPHPFLIPVPRTKTHPEKWAIPYAALSKTLLHNAMLSITTSRFGPLAGRLIRILADNDNSTKLDEKMLVLLSLIPQKQMRTLLHSMHRAGHIELQEIPKDSSQRRPGMTLFYWFFDPERCRKRMLEETYKTMTRLVQRAGVEREAVRGTVEKAERTDVVGREEELLGAGELVALHEWREKEERIWGEVGRMDELVAVLKDF